MKEAEEVRSGSTVSYLTFMSMVNDGDAEREGDGGEKRQRSPDTTPESTKRRELEQHVSVFSVEDSGAGPAYDTALSLDEKNLETPTSGRQTFISPNRLDLLKQCVDKNKSPMDEMDCTYLYNLICGLEWRIHNLEQTHKGEIEDQKRRHAHDIAELRLEIAQNQQTQKQPNSEDTEWLIHAKRELPMLSDGLQAVETRLGSMDTRVDGLEEVINMVENAVPMTTGYTSTQVTPPSAAQPRAADHSNMQADQVGDINLAAIDQELKRVGHELNNVNHRAKLSRRRAHLEGDQRDQYSRRELLRVTGVPYKPDENTTQIVVAIAHDLGVHITEADISVSHRSGRRGGRDPRPILCKFVRRDVKNCILRNKKLARNIRTDPDGNPVRIFVDEDLTKMRASVVKKLRQDRVPHFTRDGKVFIANPSSDTEFTVYDFPEDWEKLPYIDSVKLEVGIYPRD